MAPGERAWFRAFGHQVGTSTSVAGALALAGAEPPDLVVAELPLGGESGFDLIAPLWQAHPHCTIAMVSAYLSVASTAAVVRKGGSPGAAQPGPLDGDRAPSVSSG